MMKIAITKLLQELDDIHDRMGDDGNGHSVAFAGNIAVETLNAVRRAVDLHEYSYGSPLGY